MSAPTIPELEDDLRALFRAQAVTLDPEPDAPFPITAEARARSARPIAVLSVAAAVVVLVLALLTTGDRDAGLVTDDLIGDDPPADTSTDFPDGVRRDPGIDPPAAPAADGPVASLDGFETRLRQVFGSARSTDLVGTVVLGAAVESNRGPGGERTYLAGLNAADGTHLGVVAGDAVLRGDETRSSPNPADPNQAVPVELPAGVDDVVAVDLGDMRQVTVEAHGQFVSLRVQAAAPGATPPPPPTQDLLPIALALLLGAGPAGFEDGLPDRSLEDPGALDPTAYLGFLDDAAFERELATVPVEQRPGLRALREQYRAGRIRVAGPDGRSGWIGVDEYQRPRATRIDELVRVLDDEGGLVMYWSRDIGGIPRSSVERDPIPTIADLRAQFGPRTRCEGTGEPPTAPCSTTPS